MRFCCGRSCRQQPESSAESSHFRLCGLSFTSRRPAGADLTSAAGVFTSFNFAIGIIFGALLINYCSITYIRTLTLNIYNALAQLSAVLILYC